MTRTHEIVRPSAHPHSIAALTRNAAGPELTEKVRSWIRIAARKSALLSVAPPQKCNEKHGRDCNDEVESSQVADEQLPMPAKQITGDSNDCDPQRGAKKIKEKKFFPRHAQDAGHGPGDDPQAEHKAGEENRDRA